MKELFSDIYIGFIRAVENSDRIIDVLKKLTTYYERKNRISEKIKTSLLYPSFVILLLIIIAVGLKFFIFPRFIKMFSSFGEQNLIKLQNVISNAEKSFLFIFAIMAAFIFGTFTLQFTMKHNKKIRGKIHRKVLQFPVISVFIFERDLYNLSFCMETLLASKYNLTKALHSSSIIIKNESIKSNINSSLEEIKKGVKLYEAFCRQKIFPELFINWVYIGEQTQNPQEVFRQIKIYYENKTEEKINRLLSLIEPALMVCTGLIIILFVIKIIIPVFEIYGNLI